MAMPQQHPSAAERFSSGGSGSSIGSNSNGETGNEDNGDNGTDNSSEAAIPPHPSVAELNPTATMVVDGTAGTMAETMD